MMMGGLNFNVELTNPLPETYCTAVNAIFYVSRRHGVFSRVFFTRGRFFVLFFFSAGGPRCKRRRFRLEKKIEPTVTHFK
jgi:hypothetical protein